MEKARAHVRAYEARAATIEDMVRRGVSATEVATWSGTHPDLLRRRCAGLGFALELRHRVGWTFVGRLLDVNRRGYACLVGRRPDLMGLLGAGAANVVRMLHELEAVGLIRHHRRFADGGGVIDSRGIKLGRRNTTSAYTLGPVFDTVGLRSLVDRAARKTAVRQGFGTAVSKVPQLRGSLASTDGKTCTPHTPGFQGFGLGLGHKDLFGRSPAEYASRGAIRSKRDLLGISKHPEATPEEAQTLAARARVGALLDASASSAPSAGGMEAARRSDERRKLRRAEADAVVRAVRDRWAFSPPHPGGCTCASCVEYAKKTLLAWGSGP